MNFVVFDLGGAEPGYKRYTDAEVSALRARPLREIALVSYRATLVEKLIALCGAPKDLRRYSGTSE
jgi:hypothetical protein